MKKQTWILVIIAVVLLVIYLVSQRGTPVKRVADYFVKIDSAAVSKVEIKHEDVELTLEKRGDQWWLTEPVEYPANARFGEDLASKLSDLRIENLISQQTEKQEMFEVTDSQGIRVTVYAGGAPITIIMGKVSEGFRHTYMRLADSQDINLVKGVYRSYFTRNVRDWRDKTITKYDKEDLTGFVLTYPNKSMELTKLDTGWVAKIGNEEFAAKQNIVGRLTNLLGSMNCFDFMDTLDTQKYDFSKPDFQLKVTTLADEFTIKLLPVDEEAQKYVLEKDDALTHFLIYQRTAKVLMKEFDEFRPDPEEKEESHS